MASPAVAPTVSALSATQTPLLGLGTAISVAGLVLAADKKGALRLKSSWGRGFRAEYYYLSLKTNKPFDRLKPLKPRFSLISICS